MIEMIELCFVYQCFNLSLHRCLPDRRNGINDSLKLHTLQGNKHNILIARQCPGAAFAREVPQVPRRFMALTWFFLSCR